MPNRRSSAERLRASSPRAAYNAVRGDIPTGYAVSARDFFQQSGAPSSRAMGHDATLSASPNAAKASSSLRVPCRSTPTRIAGVHRSRAHAGPDPGMERESASASEARAFVGATTPERWRWKSQAWGVRPGIISNLERRAAAARAGHVRIAELETGAVGAFDVVDLRSVQVLIAQRVHI